MLFVSLVVSLLGLAAINRSRIQRRVLEGAADATAARLHAQSAVRIGMLQIEQDPNWRFNHPHGTWAADVAIGQGSYTLEGLDPSDSNLSDSPSDPLVLVGTGKQGRSVHKVQITLSPVHRGYSSLKAAIHAGDDVSINSATVTCDQVLSANDSVSANSSSVNCDVEAVGSISGSTYYGDIEAGIPPRELPDLSTVFDYYRANATEISLSSIPTGNPNNLQNPGFENGTNYWYPLDNNCTIVASSADPHTGNYALDVTVRQTKHFGPAQDIAGQLMSGRRVYCELWVKPKVADDFYVQLRLKTSEGDSTVTLIPGTSLPAGQWSQLAGSTTVSWSGTLNKAEWYVKTEFKPDGFLLDGAVCREEGSDRTIARELLSPSRNPYGASANPLGIYLIDLASQDLIIRDSRIVGTLVLLKPGSGTTIGNNTPLQWEPGVAGYPILMVDGGKVTIDPSNNGLVESQLHRNFNPAGTPYQGAEDNDQLDTYPSKLNGMLFSNDSFTFANQTTIQGAVLSSERIDIFGTLNLSHNSTYYQNPPPGFSGPEEIRILLDSARKPLN